MASLKKLKNGKKMFYIFCYPFSSEAGFILDFSPPRYTDPKANLTVPDFFEYSSSCNSLFLCTAVHAILSFWDAYKGK